MSIDGTIKSGFVSIIGLPNAGKSSFLNAVLNDNLAITSKRPQTTRKNLKGIYNDEDSQIVFVDTPGIHSVKNKLDEYMSKSIIKSVCDIDLVIVIVDIMTYENDDYSKIIKLIKKIDTKKILLINKCDLFGIYDSDAKDNSITNIKNNIINKFRDEISFEKVFLISSLKKKGINEIIAYIKNNLPEDHRFYNEEDITDEPIKQVVSEIIRQQCLYKIEKEIPHGIAIIVNSMKMSNSKCMHIDATIICEKENHKGIIIGKSGEMIKNIGTGARIAIEKFINNKTNLKLNVIVKPNWREEKTQLVNFGYDSSLI